MRQPVERVASDHEQPERRGELSLYTDEAVPLNSQLEQRVLIWRRRGQQRKWVVRVLEGIDRSERIAGRGSLANPVRLGERLRCLELGAHRGTATLLGRAASRIPTPARRPTRPILAETSWAKWSCRKAWMSRRPPMREPTVATDLPVEHRPDDQRARAFQAIGIVRRSVSSRESSKPSPMSGRWQV